MGATRLNAFTLNLNFQKDGIGHLTHRLGVHVNLSNLEHQHRVPIVRYVTEGDETVEEALVLLRSFHIRRDRELSVAREGRRLHVEAGRRHEVHGFVEGLRRARAEGPLARRLGQVQQRVDTHE